MKATGLLRFFAICAVGLCCGSCGPHMDDQVSIRPYERNMPSVPKGAVPTTGRPQTLTKEQSQLTKSPLPPTQDNLRKGKQYYHFYCEMCHGLNGKGDGPVGLMYTPKAADLSKPSVAKLTDGQIYERMLHGPGHGPVMTTTVLSDNRWPLVLYVRTFTQKPKPKPVQTGESIFNDNCSACHGTKGEKMPGWRAKVRQMSLAQVEHQIIHGGGGMPPFSGVLSSSQVTLAAKHAKELAAR